jgi:quercetin dioxygenase-like cupin family protein
MKKYSLNNMQGGWFVGNFEPSAFQTKFFEVAFAKHTQGQKWDTHFHKVATEITLVVKGKIQINDEVFTTGDIFVISPNEVVSPQFLEDSEVVVIKTPSDVNDKYVI